jgi:hypothetical protein
VSKPLIVTLVAVVCGSAVAAALAQQPTSPTLSGTVSASPARSGTPARPLGVKLAGRAELKVPEGAPRPVITGLEIWTGPGIALDGHRFPACRVAVLSSGGPSACPPKSIMGSGSLLADPRLGLDFGQAGRITLINSPTGPPTLWIVLQNPARVQAAAAGTVVHDATTRWPHHVRWTMPRALQVVAGIPITPFGLSFVLGGKAYAKDYVSTTGCPEGGWAWKLRVHTDDAQGGAAGVLDAHGRIPCRR